MSRLFRLGLASTLLLAACDDSTPRPATEGAPATAALPQLAAGDPTPAIRTDAGCDARFGTPRSGLTVVLGGPSASIAMENRVTAVEPGGARATSTMLMGPDSTRGPSHEILRRDGFVMVEGGTRDARRMTSYGPELTREAIMALRPGGVLSTRVTESTDFAGEAGRREISGTYRVVFVGCSDLEIEGARTPVKVFEVRSVARAYDSRAPEAQREGERQTVNRYWVSEQLGWVLRNDDESGSLVARSVKTGA